MNLGNINIRINCKFEHHSKELFIFEQLATAMAANSPNTFTYCMYVYVHNYTTAKTEITIKAILLKMNFDESVAKHAKMYCLRMG